MAEELRAQLDLLGVQTLDASERLHLAKPPTGADVLIGRMAELAAADPRVCPPKMTAAEVQAAAQASADVRERFTALRDALVAGVRAIDDTALAAHSDAWRAALAVYHMAQTLAVHDATLAPVVEQMQGFLRVRRGKKKPKPAANGDTPQ